MAATERHHDPQGLVLVLNVGSSSLKVGLIDPSGTRLWQHQIDGPTAALEGWLPQALAPWHDRIALVGHRMVHGGERFTEPTRIGPDVERELEALLPLAPLHNGAALAAIRQVHAWRPDLAQWACFDTAFHSTLSPAAFTYAIPERWRAEGLRRFGFHGLNHQHVAEVVQSQRGGSASLRLISCHLGAGCSLAAIRDRRSVDTTMGCTPLEGLPMASRSGSVDPGLLLHRLRSGESIDRVEH
jgi:acetate kinase